MATVLEGIRVLDFSRFLTGPYATMLLADMGAEVVRVERPGGADDRGLGPFAPSGESLPYGIVVARNKKGITLDIQSEEGRELLGKLVSRSDVVVHNYTPGSPESDLLEYERLARLNPAIIVTAVTGFGQNGPYAQRVCFDAVAQGMSGAMSYTGFPGNPPTRSGPLMVDVSTGIYAALGTMFALYHRQKTGRGQLVDVAMLDTALSFVNAAGVAAEYKLLGWVRQQQGNQSFYCLTDAFQARDGWVMLSIVGEGLWRRLCRVLGREEWVGDERFKDDMARYRNRHLILPVIGAWMSERTAEEVVRTLNKARVPCGRVNSIPEMMADPQMQAREMLLEVDFPGVGPVPMPGVVPKLSGTPGGIGRRAPLLGEHNEEVYCGLLGLSASQLSALRQKGVV
ncbi:MAG: CoA transferase [Chloroflexota bacterium]